MNIQTNISIKNLTTMRLGGNAKIVAEVETKDDLVEIVNQSKSEKQKIFVIGGGSNIVARDDGFDGIIIKMNIPGFEIISKDETGVTIRIGAGENWDSVVERVVQMGLSGVEAMSGIPGTAGAAPIQNVGAYGQEIADTLISVEALDIENSNFVTLTKSDCHFSYRDSIFRSTAAGKYIITAIDIKLSKQIPKPPFYDSLQKYLEEKNIHDFDVKNIRKAVLEIRDNKLPDPKFLASAGSFFKNTIVDRKTAEKLMENFPEIKLHQTENGLFKVPSGWLIERAGLKGKLIHGMRVFEKNALVLVNESANSYSDLSAARQEIIDTIFEKFQISIEQEPLEI